MFQHRALTCGLFALALVAIPAMSSARAEQPALPILNMAAENGGQKLLPTSDQVKFSKSTAADAPGINVVIEPGADAYPGIKIKPDGKPAWNLAEFGHVEAKLTNTGKQTIRLNLRVDNAGDWKTGPWNTESIKLEPGETGKVTVIFGFSFGQKPGFALKPEAVVGLQIFATKADQPQSFRIEVLQAAGPDNEVPTQP